MMDRSILFIDGADCHLGWGRSVNLAKAFAKNGCNVFYSEYSKPLYKNRIKLIDSDDFPILRTTTLPLRYNVTRSIGVKIIIRQIIRALEKAEFNPEVLIVCHVTDIRIIRALKQRFKPDLIIYDCADDRAAHCSPHLDQRLADLAKRLEKNETKLIGEIDMVLTVSSKLNKRVSPINKQVYTVPNGVDLSLFNMDSVKTIPLDLSSIDRPIIGLVGNLAHWVDFDLILWLARIRPEWSFVLVGGNLIDDALIRSFPDNIHYLGKKPYAEIPGYVANFDVCIVPFKDCDVAEGSDSLKVLQYMAMGKPVVSTAYRGAKSYGGLISVAETKDDFLSSVEWHLSNDSPSVCEERIEVVKEHSWQNRIERISEILDTHFDLAL